MTQRYQIDEFMMQAVMSDSKVSKEQAMRILAIQSGVQDEGVLQGLFDELGEYLVVAGWGFATPDQKGIRRVEPPRDCRRLNAPREYDNENTKLYP
ncbi:hypothetical protein [Psychrobacter celer]|uniref:hypothetical protein n=2 Tax=Psychrobacter celer TaxID=306572 RepID=UPI003FD2DF57